MTQKHFVQKKRPENHSISIYCWKNFSFNYFLHCVNKDRKNPQTCFHNNRELMQNDKNKEEEENKRFMTTILKSIKKSREYLFSLKKKIFRNAFFHSMT